ncbi:MAG: FcoT family thioesterase [Candidatus Micrarchaeia archaeon]
MYTPDCRTIKSAQMLVGRNNTFIGVESVLRVKGHFYADVSLVKSNVDHFTDIEATLCYNQMAYTLLFFIIKHGLAKEILDSSKFLQKELAYFRDDSLARRIHLWAKFALSGNGPSDINSLDVLRLMSRLGDIDPLNLRDIQFMLSFIIGKDNVKFWKPISINDDFMGYVFINRYICKRPNLIFLDTYYEFEHGKAHGDVMLAIKFNSV